MAIRRWTKHAKRIPRNVEWLFKVDDDFGGYAYRVASFALQSMAQCQINAVVKEWLT